MPLSLTVKMLTVLTMGVRLPYWSSITIFWVNHWGEAGPDLLCHGSECSIRYCRPWPAVDSVESKDDDDDDDDGDDDDDDDDDLFIPQLLKESQKHIQTYLKNHVHLFTK